MKEKCYRGGMQGLDGHKMNLEVDARSSVT